MAIWLPIVSEFKDQGIQDASRSLGSLQKKSGSFSAAIGKSMKVAGAGLLAVGAAAGVAAAAGFQLAKAAAADEAAATKLAGQLKRSAGATDAQVAATERLISKMSLATGVADDELRPALASLVRGSGDITTAQKDLLLALDVSAASGKSLQSVSDALSKAYGGNLTALAKLDPAIRNMVKEGASLDDVMAQLAGTFGGAAAEAANTAEGKFARLQIAFDEAKESIGQRLLPMVMKIVDFFSDKILPIVEKVMKKFDKGGLSGVFEFVAKKAREAFPLVVSALGNMGRQLLAKLQELGQAFLEWIGPRIRPMLQQLGKMMADAANWILDEGLPMLVDKLIELGNAFVKWVGPQIPPLLKELGKLLAKILTWIYTEMYPKLAKQALRLGGAILSWLVDLIPNALKGLGQFAWELIRNLPNIFSGLVSAMADIGGELLGSLLGALKNVGSNVFDGLKSAFVSTIDFVIGAIEGGINLAIRGLNTILDGIDKAAGPFVDFGNIPEVNLGRVGGDGIDVYPESGSDPAEEVFRPSSVSGGRSSRSSGPNVTINVNGALDPVAVAGQVRKLLNDDARRRTGTIAIP